MCAKTVLFGSLQGMSNSTVDMQDIAVNQLVSVTVHPLVPSNVMKQRLRIPPFTSMIFLYVSIGNPIDEAFSMCFLI